MQSNRGKQQNGKDQKSLQENQRQQGNILYKNGYNKGEKGKDLTEAEEIKKRWHKYTEELYKEVFNDLGNHDGVITHLDLGILKFEVK